MFEIVDKVGAGGMGDVYRARDTRLGRPVAIKVLSDIFSSDPERLARFEREARVLASLNHPNIAQVFGFESFETSRQALVMEFIDGPTLADLIRESGPVPLDRALAIARQIAAAMDAAHERGIIHRDLKPANIKVRDDGTVKVLDFGLAKAIAGDTESHDPVHSPTITVHSTQGLILGTAAYMSPEQAKGRPVDRRADVWAFGAVLFELLSGRRAFDGEDVSEVLAAVLKVEPDWTLLPADLPPPVRRLLRRCLEKEPRQRLRDIAEGMLQLEDGLANGSTSSGVTRSDLEASQSGTRAAWWRRAMPLGVTAAATAGIVLAIGTWRPASESGPAFPIRIEHAPVASAPIFAVTGSRDVAISPDGRRVAYVALAEGAPSLYARPIDQVEAGVVQGSHRATNPFFSPDGEWLGFVSENEPAQVRKVPADGGSAVLVATAPGQIFGAAWSDDGILLGQRNIGLHMVANGSTTPVALTTLDAAALENGHVWPAPVHGTQLVLFAIQKGGRLTIDTDLAVLDRATGTVTRFGIVGLQPRYLPTGHIVFSTKEGSLRAVPFDTKRVALTGEPVPLFDGVGTKMTGIANFDLSPGGHLVHTAAGTFAAHRTLVWVDREGRETPTSAPPRNYFYARVSPDGSQLALSVREEKQDVWIWDLKREALVRLTQERGVVNYGLWTPDNRIVYDSEAAGPTEVFNRRADGSGSPEQLTEVAKDGLIPFPNAVSPDGRHMIFRSLNKGPNDLFVTEMSGARRVRPLMLTPNDERNAAFSPDGTLVAFESDASGSQFEVFIRPFEGDGAITQVSIGGGVKPLWSPDGREIYYLAGNRMMVVPVTRAGGLRLGRPSPLFNTTPYFFGDFGRNYDISPDGKRFVMVKNPAGKSGTSLPVTIVLNWIEEIRARLQ